MMDMHSGPRWLVASGNPGKLRELQAMLAPRGVQLVSQKALGIADAEEPWPTFVENALTKARHGARASGLPALADDSGLCVPALGGAPGVRSAPLARAVAPVPRSPPLPFTVVQETEAAAEIRLTGHRGDREYGHCLMYRGGHLAARRLAAGEPTYAIDGGHVRRPGSEQHLLVRTVADIDGYHQIRLRGPGVQAHRLTTHRGHRDQIFRHHIVAGDHRVG